MTFALPKITRALWQIRIALLLVLLYVVVVAFWRFSTNILLPTTIAFAIGSVFVLSYIGIYFKKFSVSIDDSGIYITKGVIFKKIVIIPHMKFAFIKSFATPLTSRLNLSCTILKFSCGMIFLPELKNECVKQITEMIKNG